MSGIEDLINEAAAVSTDEGDDLSAFEDGTSTSIYASEEFEANDELLGTEGEQTSESTEEGTETSNEAATSETPSSTEEEIITVSDEFGKRRVKVNYANRDKIKQAHQMAAGMRKFQAERDKIRSELESTRTDHEDLKGTWTALEDAFSNKGVAGVIGLLSDGNQTLDSFIDSEIQKREFRSTATPEELEALDLRESQSRKDLELDKLRKEFEELKQSNQHTRETAETKALESKVNPAFDKYRFAGSLGDEVAEHMFDSMLWNTALKNLEEYEDGIELTPAMINKEFRSVAVQVKKHINKQADKKVKSTVAGRKAAAKESAQMKAMNGYTDNSLAKDAQEKIRTGDLTGLLKGWGRYNKVFK